MVFGQNYTVLSFENCPSFGQKVTYLNKKFFQLIIKPLSAKIAHLFGQNWIPIAPQENAQRLAGNYASLVCAASSNQLFQFQPEINQNLARNCAAFTKKLLGVQRQIALFLAGNSSVPFVTNCGGFGKRLFHLQQQIYVLFRRKLHQ